MTRSAWLMLVLTWGVVIYYAARFFLRVWKLNAADSEEDQE